MEVLWFLRVGNGQWRVLNILLLKKATALSTESSLILIIAVRSDARQITGQMCAFGNISNFLTSPWLLTFLLWHRPHGVGIHAAQEGT